MKTPYATPRRGRARVAGAALARAQTALPLKHAPRPTTAAITPADAMTRLYILADDSMMGREAGTAGNVKGTDYIAREARRIGLEPAGENGTYFQTIPFVRKGIDPAASLTVDGAALRMGDDFLLLPTVPGVFTFNERFNATARRGVRRRSHGEHGGPGADRRQVVVFDARRAPPGRRLAL